MIKMKITNKFYTFPVLSLLSFNVCAGPFLTDEAETVDFKKWELEFNATLTHAKESPDEKSAGFEVRFGMLPNTDIFLALGYDHISKDDEQPALHGVGDSEVGIKHRFIRETTYTPQVAIAPTIGIPTGNQTSNEKAWLELPIWIEKNWNSWSTSGGAGVVFNPAHDAKNFLFAGWKLQYDFTEDLNFGAELFYQGADSDDNRDLTLVNIGSSYKLSEVLSVDLSVGHSISGQPQTIAYLGFSLS
jgi:hypothetical protein